MLFDKEFLLNKNINYNFMDSIIENKFGTTKALFYDGENFKGKKTTVFAYLGFPICKKPKNGFPAIVLVHGGGGCAFFEWVEYWNSKGFVAIAPDFNGREFGSHKLDGEAGNGIIKENKNAGPKGYGSFESTKDDFYNSWTYHSVCNIIFANNFLRSIDIVDKNNIFLTGISWGGVLTCIVSGVDNRFKAFASIYGGGKLDKIPGTFSIINMMGKEKQKDWLSIFDPINYLSNCNKPFLFSVGTDEPFFSIETDYETSKVCKGSVVFSFRKSLSHYHRWKDEENMFVVYDYFNQLYNKLSISFDYINDANFFELKKMNKIKKCILNYATKINDLSLLSDWKSIEFDLSDSLPLIPNDTLSYFYEFYFDNNLIYSSKLFKCQRK